MPPKPAPTKRAAVVRPNAAPQTDEGFTYPGPNELNVPPAEFRQYMRCFYGKKGVGKSTLASQFPKNFTFMFEPMRRNLTIRQLNLIVYSPKDIIDGAEDVWAKIKLTTARMLDDPTIETITFDSIDLFYDSCYSHICAQHRVCAPSDSKNGPDIWNEIKYEFSAYFNVLAQSRMGINLLSHLKKREIEQLDSSKLKIREPSCAPACLQYIRQACDFVFCFGELDGFKIMQLRDPTDMAFTGCGAQDRFLQPNGDPVNMLEMPKLNEKENGYERLVRAFNNECWDHETPESERVVSKPVAQKPKGPAPKGPVRR
jgi:hypothetical protein